MVTKQTIQNFQQLLEKLEDKNDQIVAQLKLLEVAKKDKVAKPIMVTLNQLIKDFTGVIEEVETESGNVQQQIEKKVTKKKDAKKKEPPKEEKRPLLSEQQQKVFDLKSKLTKNVEIQTTRIQDELSLHHHLERSRPQTQPSPRRFDDEPIMSKTNSLRLMKMFERKSLEANARLKEMEIELNRAKEQLKKYQHLYELEKRRLPSGHRSRAKSAKIDSDDSEEEDDADVKLPPESSYSLLGENMRVNDVIRKNDFLVEENKKLRREIQRLKADNNSLLKKAKFAMDHEDSIMHHLNTSESNRKSLSKRLEKEKTKHHQLSRSVTRQASDWILLKKQLAQLDEDYRLIQINPMSTTGAEQRYHVHPSTRNTYMPRKMYPVEQYAAANQE